MTLVRSGADAICAALRSAGIEIVFGVPGTQTVAFYDALRSAKIRTVTATHELAATFMAQAYFRASGRLAAVSVIPGPGFAFTLPALAEAHLDSAALLVLTAPPPECPLGRRRAQAIDQRTMAKPVVKEVIDLADAEQASETIQRAAALARSGEPGPVLVQIASGVHTAPVEAPLQPSTPVRQIVEPDTCSLQEAARFVVSGQRVLFYVGQGAAEDIGDLRRVVPALGAIVATTPSGRGALPENDDRLLPLDATGDLEGFNSVARECDVIVVLGAALGENGSVGFGLDFPRERLVRIDSSPAVLATPPAAHLAVQASCAEFLASVVAELAVAARPPSDRGYTAADARALRERLSDRRAGGPADARIAGAEPGVFFAALRRALPNEACLALDSGMHQLLTRRHFVVTTPRSLLFPADFQSMAFGIPAAIGAKLALPDRTVVALIGDGGFAMTGLELLTAAKIGIPLPVIVFDDGALGLIRLDQLLAYGHAHGTGLGRLEYESVASALGCACVRAGVAEIGAALDAAMKRTMPTLIIVAVGDAPALRQRVRKRRMGEVAKGLLGPRLVSLLRRLRSTDR